MYTNGILIARYNVLQQTKSNRVKRSLYYENDRIIGGMGPMATVDLLQKIIEKLQQPMKTQEHIHILVDNNTAIPDRTAAMDEDRSACLNFCDLPTV